MTYPYQPGDPRFDGADAYEAYLDQTIGSKGQMDIQSRIMGMPNTAQEVMRCLFFHGPTRDGDLPCKSGRDVLCHLGLVERMDGWQWLTRSGVDTAITVMLLDGEKDKWQRQRANAV